MNRSTLHSTFDSLTSNKQQIAARFGQAAPTYHAQAQMQQACAQRLLHHLDQWQIRVPCGPILEIGCGTGFVTQELLRRFAGRSLEITDLSAEMLDFCRSQLDAGPAQPLLSFRQLDGEAVAAVPDAYAMIVSGFAVQWFGQPVQSLARLLQFLKPDGVLLISFPTCDSFPEWKAICDQLNLPYTANSLPDAHQVIRRFSTESFVCHFCQEDIGLNFADAAEFFRSFKAIGAGFSPAKKHLTAGQMRRLIYHWNRQSSHGITVHCRVFYGAIQR